MFSTTPGALRMYDHRDGVQLTVTYELNRDLVTIRRKVQSFLDYLGALGGLSGTLYTLFGLAIIVLQYKAVISYVGNQLFLIKTGDENKHGNKVDYADSLDNPHTKKHIPIGFFSSIKLSFQRLGRVAGCKRCCKKFYSRRDRLTHLAEKLAKDELKLIRWLKFMRSTNLAMTKLFTVQQWKKIQEQAQFKTITIDNETDKPFLNEDTDSEEMMDLDKEKHPPNFLDDPV